MSCITTSLFIPILLLVQTYVVAPHTPAAVWCAPSANEDDLMRSRRRTSALEAVVHGNFSTPPTLFQSGHGRWAEVFNIPPSGAMSATYAGGRGKEEVTLEAIIPYIHEQQLVTCLTQANEVMSGMCAGSVPAAYVIMKGENTDTTNECRVDPTKTHSFLGFGTSIKFLEDLFDCPFPGCIYGYPHETLKIA